MTQTLVIAMIGGRRCAFPAEDVKSVIETSAIVPVPRAPEYILGMTALRSQALTVLDCRIAIGCGGEDHPTDERTIVVSHGGHSYALRVDRVDDITEAVGDPVPVPGGLGTQWSRISRGMVETTGGPALVLDMASLITCPHNSAAAA
ncbi:chemotaxis protein CheW [Erythrobacteraceae bacterium E2-1 Yellow Sea]|nr:chemotaxis protein CheW [Erythrobacteraceae bacterium E2-1 Yellow Sea]